MARGKQSSRKAAKAADNVKSYSDNSTINIAAIRFYDEHRGKVVADNPNADNGKVKSILKLMWQNSNERRVLCGEKLCKEKPSIAPSHSSSISDHEYRGTDPTAKYFARVRPQVQADNPTAPPKVVNRIMKLMWRCSDERKEFVTKMKKIQYINAHRAQVQAENPEITDMNDISLLVERMWNESDERRVALNIPDFEGNIEDSDESDDE